MHSNYLNTGNNLPAGYDDSGELPSFGLKSKYNMRIAQWEKDNKAELTELENAVIAYYKHPECVYDNAFMSRLEYLKTKFPSQFTYYSKQQWK